jgi:biopolymer transport protein ExbB
VRSLIVLVALLVAAPAAAEVDLDAAWQREYAWLLSEQRALQERLDAQGAEEAAQIAAVEEELRTLQARLVAATAAADRAEIRLSEGEGAAAARADDDARLASALEQAERTVGAPSGELSSADRVRHAFARAAEQIAEAGRVAAAPEAYFGLDGAEVQGEVVRVGRVAAFGRSGGVALPLVPAGGGRWTAWSGEAGGLGSGLFLLEDTARTFAESPPKTLAVVMEQGGVIGWVIAFLGLSAALMLLLRAAILLRAPSRMEDRTLAATAGAPGLKRRQREEILDQQMIEAGVVVGRFAVPVQVVAAVAPLLGLLGTVTGMIGTFDIITRYGTGDPKMLSGGISEALVTTELGLIVAIPCLLVGSLLSARADRILDRIENRALEGIRLVGRGGGATGSDQDDGCDDDDESPPAPREAVHDR